MFLSHRGVWGGDIFLINASWYILSSILFLQLGIPHYKMASLYRQEEFTFIIVSTVYISPQAKMARNEVYTIINSIETVITMFKNALPKCHQHVYCPMRGSNTPDYC